MDEGIGIPGTSGTENEPFRFQSVLQLQMFWFIVHMFISFKYIGTTQKKKHKTNAKFDIILHKTLKSDKTRQNHWHHIKTVSR